MTTKDQQDLERWERRGEALGKAKSANQWAIADWVCDGMKRFRKREVYNAVEKWTGMSRASLYQFKLTAESFPKISTRIKNLSFGHHRLVASDEYTAKERRGLLLYARDRELSIVRFAAYLAKLKNGKKRTDDTPTNSDDAAEKVVELCKDFCKSLSSHRFIGELLRGDPPGDRQQLLRELTATAEEFNRIAKELQAHWEDHDVGHYYKAGAGR
jgi:hypothetical protein